MAYVISSDCISCGACVDSCPVSSIADGDGIYAIDEGTCIDCGACMDTCPIEAISQGGEEGSES
jgi:ferredoxin